MKPRQGYIPVDSMFPHKGLNTLVPSTMLEASYSPSCSDVTVTDGSLVKRKGYNLLGALTNVGVAEPIIGLINFQASDSTNYLVAITTTKRFKYNSGTNAWDDITGATAWTGNETNRLSYVIAQGTDVSNFKVLIITNGKDMPQIWDGAGNFANVSFNYPGLVTCETITQINDHLVMGNITGATVAKQNVAWSATGTINEWLDGLLSAGEQTLFDTNGPIKALVPLSGRVVVYSEDSIHLMTFLGGELVFAFEKILDDTRLVSSQSIVNLGSYHVFLSQDNFLVFDGSRNLTAAADNVHQTYRNELSSTYKYLAFAFLDRARRRVFFNVPTGSDTSKIYQLDYDLGNVAQWMFTPASYSARPLAMGFYLQSVNLLWNSPSIASFTWADMAQIWGAGSSSQGFPSRVIGGPLGQVYLADDTVFNDAGVAVVAQWDSMDFVIPQEYESELARWIEIEFEAYGDMVDIYYSKDLGGSYSPVQTAVGLVGSWTRYRIPIDVISRTLRFRFVNGYSSSDFRLRWVRPWFQPTGPR